MGEGTKVMGWPKRKLRRAFNLQGSTSCREMEGHITHLGSGRVSSSNLHSVPSQVRMDSLQMHMPKRLTDPTA